MDTLARRDSESGMTLVELLVALVVLSIGILSVGGLFPAGSRGQDQARLLTSADMYAQQKLEELNTLSWADPALAVGRHPAVTYDSLGASKRLLRSYQVTAMTAPLDNLRKVVVTVEFTSGRHRTVSVTSYVRR
jgi:prepilin-type N-terminal cleavage/methylation domain-containing protein